MVVDSAVGVEVTFHKTHFGHSSNLGRCRLTADERAMIAGTVSRHNNNNSRLSNSHSIK